MHTFVDHYIQIHKHNITKIHKEKILLRVSVRVEILRPHFISGTNL